MTSSAPEVRVCRQTAVTVEPAWTSMILSEGVVGLGGPLQASESEVTSWIGPSYDGVRTPYDTGCRVPPLSSCTKMVWAEASEAALAARPRRALVRIVSGCAARSGESQGKASYCTANGDDSLVDFEYFKQEYFECHSQRDIRMKYKRAPIS